MSARRDLPRLSVCIPTWRGGPFLRRTLDSILVQRGVELQVLVADDASDDDTSKVARSFADPRVRVHDFAERLGLSGNWNRALALRGDCDYVALVGQDDRLAPDWAEQLVGRLEGHPEADLAFGRRDFEFGDAESRAAVGDFFDRRYPEMMAPFYERIEEIIPSDVMIEEAMRFQFEINLIGEPSFAVFRATHPAVAEGFDPAISQLIDWEFFTRFFADRPLLHCPDPVGTYHIHGRGQSVENAPLSRHYREFDHVLGCVLRRFAGRLRDDQRAALEQRRGEARRLQVEWTERERDGA